ncbi:FliO/MopB family protein [Paradevosia shaoguanensis]|uniref:Flagellar biosynthetic protein FliO n=1 Tax=Paradevosia shaoguanensis TaxID=1335043 RepID=A0AA41QND9_9HYPH|nr:flagellar biosynthetic protein FliO [Paradevosia shaoguanensis]MCF1743175.1 flagellar biosynthetic protein FliO [Paradevosia shaoguanensis]MCI0127658.1 flagellar biosynthetic protein FliO [Paradevosia shaoguanensis]
MQFLTGLFGGSEGAILNAVLALGIVLVLIILALWLLKFIFRASNNVGRGKNRRLSVVDSLAVDQKRQLVIVRRDDVEHLILLGGPQDVVIETGIPAEQQQARQPVRRPAPPTPAKPASASQAPVPAVEPALRPAANKLRELAAPPPARQPTSLRHTGFMRANEDAEPVAIHAKADSPADDSARTGHPDDAGARGGDDSQSDNPTARTADSH